MKELIFKTKEEIQAWIDKTGIDHVTQIKENYKDVYYCIKKLGLLGKLNYPNKECPFRFEEGTFMGLDDFQQYVDENKIECRKEFREKHSTVYNRFIRVIETKDRNLLHFPKKGTTKYNGTFLTAEEYNLYIRDNNLESPIDLRKFNPSLYDHLYNYVPDEEKKKINWKYRWKSWNTIDTVEKLQKFVQENYVINRKDLHKRFPGLYVKFQKSLDSIHFMGKVTISQGEKFIINQLIKYGINFSTQKTFPGFKNTDAYRFDIYLIDKNILIEHQGEGHFGKGRYYSEELIESDKIKKKFAEDNHIKLIYFTIYKSEYEKFGYFSNVITDVDVLLREIGIDPDKDSPKDNWEEVAKEYFLDDINYYRQFMKNNNIRTRSELKKNHQSTYSRLKSLGLLSDLFDKQNREDD